MNRADPPKTGPGVSPQERKVTPAAPPRENSSIPLSASPARPTEPDALAAALEMVRRLTLEVGAEAGALEELGEGPNTGFRCAACGGENALENKFCAACGVALDPAVWGSGRPSPAPGVEAEKRGDHHYHHHYHHHYFAADAPLPASYQPRPSAGGLGASPQGSVEPARVMGPGGSSSLSRSEAAARMVSEHWALACNTKHLDDLVGLYTADAIVMRPNVPAVRGTAAIREFFFAVLDAGLGEVELEPLRTELVGEVAYEAGRCKMLVPVAMGKRREERGKYLMVMTRQAGEWKVVSDCWSSDLGLSLAAAPEGAPGAGPSPPGAAVGRPGRKST